MSKERKPTFDPEHIRNISEVVYRHELGEDDTRRMLEKDNDGGKKLRNRAAAYDGLTRSYLKALGFTPVTETIGLREG